MQNYMTAKLKLWKLYGKRTDQRKADKSYCR